MTKIQKQDILRKHFVKNKYIRVISIILSVLGRCTDKSVIKFPHSRGVSGALYLQSATVGVMLMLRVIAVYSCP